MPDLGIIPLQPRKGVIGLGLKNATQGQDVWYLCGVYGISDLVGLESKGQETAGSPTVIAPPQDTKAVTQNASLILEVLRNPAQTKEYTLCNQK